MGKLGVVLLAAMFAMLAIMLYKSVPVASGTAAAGLVLVLGMYFLVLRYGERHLESLIPKAKVQKWGIVPLIALAASGTIFVVDITTQSFLIGFFSVIAFSVSFGAVSLQIIAKNPDDAKEDEKRET